MAGIVYATQTVTTFSNGAKVRVVKDDPWRADDPFVSERPDLFGDEPDDVVGTVEQATATPGERRSTKRAAKKAAAREG